MLTEEPEVPTISWVGRIDPIKDLVTLLRAFSLVIREIPQARLRIFGSPPQGGEAYLERCRAEAAELGLGEQATFEGRVPDIREAYAAGHVFVLCSISEGFPYSLIEAMACGRACVGTDVGGVSEALGDAAGLVVPPRSPAALADACVRLLRDDGLRRTLGAAARARAVEHFTVDRAVSAFDELYQLLGSGVSREIAAPGPDATPAPVTALPRQEADHHQGETVPQSPRLGCAGGMRCRRRKRTPWSGRGRARPGRTHRRRQRRIRRSHRSCRCWAGARRRIPSEPSSCPRMTGSGRNRRTRTGP